MVKDMRGEIRDAYSRRAAEYAAHLGSMDAVHPADRHLVDTWADEIEGPAIDARCGPGHWTNYPAERGVAVRGIDFVPEFIAHAQATYPGIPVHLGVAGGLQCDQDDQYPIRIRWFELRPFCGH